MRRWTTRREPGTLRKLLEKGCEGDWDKRVESVRRVYATGSPEILGFVEPIQIKMSTMYFDGGILEVTMVDKQAKELRFKLRPFTKGLTEKIREYEYFKGRQRMNRIDQNVSISAFDPSSLDSLPLVV